MWQGVVPVKVLITRANKHLSPTLAFTVCLNPSEGTLLEDWIKKRIHQGGIEKFTNQNKEAIYRGWNDSRVYIHTYIQYESVSFFDKETTECNAHCTLLSLNLHPSEQMSTLNIIYNTVYTAWGCYDNKHKNYWFLGQRLWGNLRPGHSVFTCTILFFNAQVLVCWQLTKLVYICG